MIVVLVSSVMLWCLSPMLARNLCACCIEPLVTIMHTNGMQFMITPSGAPTCVPPRTCCPCAHRATAPCASRPPRPHSARLRSSTRPSGRAAPCPSSWTSSRKPAARECWKEGWAAAHWRRQGCPRATPVPSGVSTTVHLAVRAAGYGLPGCQPPSNRVSCSRPLAGRLGQLTMR